MGRISDAETLLRHVPEDGSSIGNITLRDILGWEVDKYFRVRQQLVDDGQVEVGGGRGGSVYRIKSISPRPRSSKQLPSNPDTVIPIFPLAAATLPDIDEAIEEAPVYGEFDFRELVCNTIGALHQIPRLFHKKTGIRYQLKQVEAYFGRSSCGASAVATNLSQRLRAGREQREHEYGMIFAKTSIRASLRYERHGIRLLQALQDMDGLCISNNSFAAVGRVGAVEPGFLYMTFRMLEDEPEAARELTKEEIKELVREYRREIGARSRENDAAVEGFEVGLETANNVNFRGEHKAKVIKYDE